MKNSRFLISLLSVSIIALSSCTVAKKKSKKTSSSNEQPTSDEVTTSIPGTSAPTSTVPSSSYAPTSAQSSNVPSSSLGPVPSSNVPVSSSVTPASSSIAPASSSVTPSTSSTPTPPPEEYVEIPTLSKRMPAEFEKCEMVTMCYPEMMSAAAYKEIAKDNKILLLCNPSSNGSSRISQAQNWVASNGMNSANFTYLDMDLDDDNAYWARDFSPFYVYNNLDLGIVDFTYNRSMRPNQNKVPQKLSTYFSMYYSKMDLVHTGGNLMQDGRGTAFSDDLVISENSSNESKVRSQMETYTGTDNYVITIDPQGDYIAHVDCWAKIVAPDKIIVAKLPQSNERYQYYEQVANELANTKCCYGYNYKIYRVEEPGGSTIAPYTNSLIANNHVYLPLGTNSTYNEKAIQVYQEALPGYTIHGIANSSQHSFENTDALHCRTHEIPSPRNVFIDSREVLHGNLSSSTKFLVKCNVVSYDKQSLKSVKLHYSINNASYQVIDMNQYKETSNYTFEFTSLKQGDNVKYYIEATDLNENTNSDPVFKDLDPHQFNVI